MKYSAVVLTAFAAGAFARALPADDYDPAGVEAAAAPYGNDNDHTKKDNYGGDNDNDKNKNNYGSDNNKKDNYGGDNKKDNDKDNYGKKDNDKDNYGKKDDDYKHGGHRDNYEVPVKQNTCDENRKSGYKPKQPYPDFDRDYDNKSWCKDLKWQPKAYAGKDLDFSWDSKDSHKRRTRIEVYGCNDYSKPIYKVCDECDHKNSKWRVPDDCAPTDWDDHKGTNYRIKIIDMDKPDCFTWGGEFPIYNDKWYEGKDYKKNEEKCAPTPPPCPAPAPAPAPAPETPSYPAPEAPAPAPEAPAAPVEAPAAPAAPETYPTPEAPAALVTNQTTDSPAAFTGGSSVFRASVSVIVGVAALVTFAL